MTIRERFKEKHPRIYARILECQKEQDNEPNDKLELTNGEYSGNFKWSRSKEGQDFWQTINNDTTEKYQIFYDKYPEEEFVLPEKWCVKITKENLEQLKTWSNSTILFVSGYLTSTKLWYETCLNYTEITFEQFQQYVLKEPKLATQEKVTKSVEKTEFKKGDFIVILSGRQVYHNVCNNFIYEVALNHQELTVKKSNHNKEYKAYNVRFDQSGDTWRYANKQEVAEYQRINKPYDVTTLTKIKTIEKWSVGSYVVFCKDFKGHFLGYIDEITEKGDDIVILKNYNSLVLSREKDGEIKWFATRQEAEEFAKILTKVEEKFIAGQWYKYRHHIGKFLSYDTGIFQVSEYIYEGKYYKQLSNWGHVNEDYLREPLTDLSEIQQYLPLGHPDKVFKVEYEVGKWYKAVNKDYFGKFLEFKDNCFVSNEKYLQGYNDYVYKFNPDYTWIPATIEELRNFLPEGHIDRQETKTETMEEFKDKEYVYKHNGGASDTVYQIDKVTEKSYTVKHCGVYSKDTFTDYFRKALPHEIPTNTESKSNTMSNEELLAYAREHYVIGVKFQSENDDYKTREIQPFHDETTVEWTMSGNNVRCDNGMSTIGGFCSNPLIYNGDTKKWATIVSTPKAKEVVDDELKVEDRVQCVKEYNGSYTIHVGMTGTYLGISKYNSLSVKWDNFTNGHSLDGLLEGNDKNKGYYVGKENVKKISNNQESIFPVEQIKEQIKVVNNQTTNNKVLLLPTKEIYVRKSKNN
jgi:hypothetical protein